MLILGIKTQLRKWFSNSKCQKSLFKQAEFSVDNSTTTRESHSLLSFVPTVQSPTMHKLSKHVSQSCSLVCKWTCARNVGLSFVSHVPTQSFWNCLSVTFVRKNCVPVAGEIFKAKRLSSETITLDSKMSKICILRTVNVSIVPPKGKKIDLLSTLAFSALLKFIYLIKAKTILVNSTSPSPSLKSIKLNWLIQTK